MKIVIGCEESQRVLEEFLNMGFDAYSNDIIDCSGNYPERHLKMDIFKAIELIQPDVLIAFPPCTFLTNTANRSFVNNPERWKKRLEAMLFVHKLMNLPIKHIAIENPIGAISTHIRKPDQIIQPYWFGEKDSKSTCLWLKNLPLLKPTNMVEPEYCYDHNGRRYSKTHFKTSSTNNPEAAKLRSKTYPGVAKAMGTQWGSYFLQ